MSFLRSVLEDVFHSIYQIFGISLTTAVLFMFFWMYAREHEGMRKALREWIQKIRSSREFRRVFLFALCTALILCKTLFCRKIWGNPLKDVIGPWGLYDRDGNLYVENIENVALMLPFTFTLMLAFGKKLWNGKKPLCRDCILTGIKYAGMFSLVIELSQLFFKLGAIQITDLVYNLLGGVLGGLCYWLYDRREEKRVHGAQRKETMFHRFLRRPSGAADDAEASDE